MDFNPLFLCIHEYILTLEIHPNRNVYARVRNSGWVLDSEEIIPHMDTSYIIIVDYELFEYLDLLNSCRYYSRQFCLTMLSIMSMTSVHDTYCITLYYTTVFTTFTTVILFQPHYSFVTNTSLPRCYQVFHSQH